jgi:hypothetical protein
LEVIGLELSSTASEAANAYLAESLLGMSAETRSRAKVLGGDFYSFEAEPFDIGYDYTVSTAKVMLVSKGLGDNKVTLQVAA